MTDGNAGQIWKSDGQGGWHWVDPDPVDLLTIRYTGKVPPRDLFLRAMAQDASERLGWEWKVARPNVCCTHGEAVEWYYRPAHQLSDEMILCDANFAECDELHLLASIHGRFLLEDAMKEGKIL